MDLKQCAILEKNSRCFKMTDLIDGQILNSGIFVVIHKLCDASETDVADREKQPTEEYISLHSDTGTVTHFSFQTFNLSFFQLFSCSDTPINWQKHQQTKICLEFTEYQDIEADMFVDATCQRPESFLILIFSLQMYSVFQGQELRQLWKKS